ncbi:MAG: hypothetical protein R3B09_26405 [Nannocystaceae bacterium]
MTEAPPNELEWLRDCWDPTVHDVRGLARLQAAIAARPVPVVEPWREVGRATVTLAELPALAVEARLSMHRSTVMDLAVGPSGDAASVDFSGRWSVWDQASLRERARGDLRREARAISLSEDGARIAALVNLGESARYNYDAFIVALDGEDGIHCRGRAVERVRWEGEFLALGGALGYRVHHASGALVCGDESPKGLSAACFVDAPPRGLLRCVRRGVLGGVELGTRRALPCLDLAPLARARYHWRQAGFDVRSAGDLVALSPSSRDVFVLELERGRPIVHLALEGVEVVDMKLAFDASGRSLLLSATHLGGQQVTHLVYVGSRGAVVGALTTSERMFGHHARAVMAYDHRRVFAADGDTIVAARWQG